MGSRSMKKPLFYLFVAFLVTWGSARANNVSPDAQLYVRYFPQIFYQEQPAWIGPDGGTIVAVAYAPSASNVVYAGTWGGGVFRSNDGGGNWQSLSDGLGNYLINSLAVDPKNAAIVYAGTYKGGIYKSDDGGEHWALSSKGIQSEAIVYSIVIDPGNPKTVYAATRGKSNGGKAPWNGVVYKSTTGGKKWFPVLTKVGGGSQQDWAYALGIHPNKPKVIYAATHEHGIYRSMDAGKNWESVNDGLTDLSTRAVVVDADTRIPAKVYTGVWKKTGVFKSNNSGDTWRLEADGLKGEQIYRVVIDPKKTSNLYLATFTHGVIKSNNAGDSWFRAGLRNDQITALAINPQNNKILFAGTEGNGLFKGTHYGESWEHSQKGLSASWTTSLLVHRNTPNLFFASLYGGGVVKSADGGKTWEEFNQNLQDRYINKLVFDPVNPNLLYALTDKKGLFRCDLTQSPCWQPTGDNLPSAATNLPTFGMEQPFVSWQSLVEPVDEVLDDYASFAPEGKVAALLRMRFSLSNPGFVYMGTKDEGVYRSYDGGSTWEKAGLSGKTIWDLAVDAQTPSHVFAAANQGTNGGIWETMDGGAHWNKHENTGFDGLSVFSLSLVPTDTHGLLAGTAEGIYRLTNGAWQSIGLTDKKVTAIAVSPLHPRMIVAGTTDGAFLSKDEGKHWFRYPEVLNGFGITEIHFDPSKHTTLYYSTNAHGVLKATLP